jgi:hypothetical protein
VQSADRRVDDSANGFNRRAVVVTGASQDVYAAKTFVQGVTRAPASGGGLLARVLVDGVLFW